MHYHIPPRHGPTTNTQFTSLAEEKEDPGQLLCYSLRKVADFEFEVFLLPVKYNT